MITRISESHFINSFDEAGRGNNFTYVGRKALYEYFSELEDDCGIEMELDPVGHCCEYSEYVDINELKNDYAVPEDCEDDDEALEYFREQTMVIELDNGGLIIQAY